MLEQDLSFTTTTRVIDTDLIISIIWNIFPKDPLDIFFCFTDNKYFSSFIPGSSSFMYPFFLLSFNQHSPFNFLSFSCCSKNQQYDCKWYIPLSEMTFQGPEEAEPLTIPQVPDEELDAMKVKISHLRSEIQREKVS